MVYTESLKYCFRLVIISEDKAAAAFVADIFHFCRSIYDMVSSSAVYTGSSSAHAVHDILVRNFYIDRIVHLLAHLSQRFVKSLRLRDRTREAVKHVSVRTVVLLYSVHNQVDN